MISHEVCGEVHQPFDMDQNGRSPPRDRRPGVGTAPAWPTPTQPRVTAETALRHPFARVNACAQSVRGAAVGGRVAESEISVALIGFGGAVVGAAATVLAGKFQRDGNWHSALLSQLTTHQAGLTDFVNPYVAARVRLQPCLGGVIPDLPWEPLTPHLPSKPPPWVSMSLNPQLLFQFPHEIKRDAYYVDTRIPAHQASAVATLDALTLSAIRTLHRNTVELVELYTREFNELLRRGLGVR